MPNLVNNMSKKKFNVLFLCTGNSARSIMAEALLQRWGAGRFNPYSAGSKPKNQVNPFAIKLLKANNFNTDLFRSKSWNEFEGEYAPEFNFIFTVCDCAANEVCPVWPGQPMSAHWGIKDPDKPELSDDEQYRLFQNAFRELEHRIKIFTCLPLDNLDALSLQKELNEIGKSTKS